MSFLSNMAKAMIPKGTEDFLGDTVKGAKNTLKNPSARTSTPSNGLTKGRDWIMGNDATDALNERQNQRQEETYMRERAYDFRLAQLAERQSIPNQVQGMQGAGFAPVALGSPNAQVASGSTAQPTGGNAKSGGKFNPLSEGIGNALDAIGLKQAEANVDLTKATTEKTRQEKDNLEADHEGIQSRSNLSVRDFDAKKEYDAIMTTILKRDYKSVYDAIVKTRYGGDYEKAEASMTSGSFEAFGVAQHLRRQIAEDAVEELVSDKILKMPEVIDVMASMPRLDARKMSNEIEYIGIQAKELARINELEMNYGGKFKDAELEKIKSEKNAKIQEIQESIGRVEKMGSEKAKNWTESGKNIITSLTSVFNVFR